MDCLDEAFCREATQSRERNLADTASRGLSEPNPQGNLCPEDGAFMAILVHTPVPSQRIQGPTGCNRR